jgi:hypothetical protein
MFCEVVVTASHTSFSRPSRITAKSDGPEPIKSDGVRTGSKQYEFILAAS